MNNLYYVGGEGLASYLVTTPDGNILINSSLEQSVPLIQASIEKLGFKFSDTKILLISHAHWDHCAGSAKIIQMTGAQYMVMTEDVPVVESGGKKDFQYGNDQSTWYPPAKVDRSLKGAESVRLGGAVLIGHKTAGHTKGCTTWTMSLKDDKTGKMCDRSLQLSGQFWKSNDSPESAPSSTPSLWASTSRPNASFNINAYI